MGERRSLGALGSPCSGVRGAPLSQMEEAVVEDGAARGGDGGASQAVGRGRQPLWSPKTAPASRQRRRGDRVGHARSTTADDRQVRRRGALFSGEGDAAGVDGSRAPAHTPSDAPQPNGRAGGAPGQGTALVSDVDAAASEAILSGGGPTGAQSDVTAGASPAAVCKSGLEWAPYALVRAAASRRAANASQSRAVAQVA